MRAFRPGPVTRAHARFVATRPRLALMAAVSVALVGGVLARDVRLDNNFAALFATSSAEARFREDYRAAFGPDDGLLAVVLTVDEVGTADGRPSQGLVGLVDDVSRAVADVPGVARVPAAAAASLVAPTA
jgi:uncharacterized membrane protein YdfJ with MMPL/SSD domain